MAPMSNKSMIGMMMTLFIMMLVMNFRDAIGHSLDFIFKHIAFDGQYPVLTLIIAGLVMITASTIIRSFMSDPIKMAKSQQIQSDFNREFRMARIENNLFKLKKLQEQQPKMMSMSMESSASQMKIMPLTMLFIIPVYAWVYYFLKTGDTAAYFNTASMIEMTYVNMPWGSLDLNAALLGFFPAWIVVYTIVSLPIGQIENRLIRFILLRRRLDELNLIIKRDEAK